MIKQHLIILSLTLAVFNILAQKNSSCNFKKLSKLILQVNSNNTKSELDKIFKVEGLISSDSGKSDSTVKIYNYQFCDEKISHTYIAAFKNNKLTYILKSFKNGECFNDKGNNQKNFKINSTYKEVKDEFKMDGDLKMIIWDQNTGKEIQTEYLWMSCDNVNYYSIVFKDGKLTICNRFPQQPDYSKPNKGKK